MDSATCRRAIVVPPRSAARSLKAAGLNDRERPRVRGGVILHRAGRPTAHNDDRVSAASCGASWAACIEEGQVDYGSGPPRPALTHNWAIRESVRLLVWRSTTQIWAERHERAFRRLGGTVRVVVHDNLPRGCSPRIYDPTLNPLYRDVLAHSHRAAVPATLERNEIAHRRGSPTEHPPTPVDSAGHGHRRVPARIASTTRTGRRGRPAPPSRCSPAPRGPGPAFLEIRHGIGHRRALPGEHLAGLGDTREFHHGLLGYRGRASTLFLGPPGTGKRGRRCILTPTPGSAIPHGSCTHDAPSTWPTKRSRSPTFAVTTLRTSSAGSGVRSSSWPPEM